MPMTAVETAKFNDMCRTVKTIVDTVPNQIKSIQDQMDKLAAYKADYPDKVAELDTYLTAGKTALTNLAGRY